MSVGSSKKSTSSGGSGTDENAIHDNVANEISALTEKSALVDDDLIIIEDSEDSFNKKKAKKSSLSSSGGSTRTMIMVNAHRDSGLTNNRISLLDGTSGHQDHSMAQDVAPTLPLSVGDTQAMNDSRKWGAIIIGDDYDSLAIQVIVRNTNAIVADGDASVVLYHAPRSAFTDGTANLDMDVIAIKELDLQAANSSQMFSWALAGALTDSGEYGDGDFLFLTILNETGSSAEFRWNYTIMGVKN